MRVHRLDDDGVTADDLLEIQIAAAKRDREEVARTIEEQLKKYRAWIEDQEKQKRRVQHEDS